VSSPHWRLRVHHYQNGWVLASQTVIVVGTALVQENDISILIDQNKQLSDSSNNIYACGGIAWATGDIEDRVGYTLWSPGPYHCYP
jgi:hypothetical protein